MLNWGVMSAGGIAYVFCNAMRFTDSGQIRAIASRTQSRMDRLVNDFGIPRQYTNYEALLEDDEIDAIYIATIHPLHAEWAIKCAEAGKHILVEKPISMNYAEAAAMVEAARENDVFLMEAFMYRCHPQIQRVVQTHTRRRDRRYTRGSSDIRWTGQFQPTKPDLQSRNGRRRYPRSGVLYRFSRPPHRRCRGREAVSASDRDKSDWQSGTHRGRPRRCCRSQI